MLAALVGALIGAVVTFAGVYLQKRWTPDYKAELSALRQQVVALQDQKDKLEQERAEAEHLRLTPHSLVVDNNDVIYVADRGNSRIQIFDTEGNRKAVWNLPTAPWALCLTNGPTQVMFVGSVGRVVPEAGFARREESGTPEENGRSLEDAIRGLK